ncbi:RNA-directed DNA polymerase from mobile element jockey [Plakobranchus ocellatus]|uniref:RNA-directed DNA polymerase from mobile element jockey n=1 Tax=Plakobranchus ocellatus TaxID=259542 RepID=A0AAV4C2L4_9GAST|nr:RNA-directed DNA polymerase from mobile element jockey [Plakobranchus ocellatus]
MIGTGDGAHSAHVGPDGVYYLFLRHLPESCLHILLKLLNNIWTTVDIPPSWREASVVPIPKPGKDPSDPSNYRPIALTSCLCKTLERMVNDRLVHVLESRNLLSKVQCGFRMDHSTLDHLVRLNTIIKKAFARKKRKFFFDLEKAYDITWRQRIYTEPALHLDGQPIPVKGDQGNENVDKLAKAALNRASCSGKLICWSDLKPETNAYIHSVWQKIGMLKGPTSCMRYSPTWEKTSTKELQQWFPLAYCWFAYGFSANLRFATNPQGSGDLWIAVVLLRIEVAIRKACLALITGVIFKA